MWMMTKVGFFSVVEKPKNTICIRSRSITDIIDLEKLIPFQDIEGIMHTPKADYPYRMEVPKETWDTLMSRLSKLVDYSNFKDEVRKTNHKRESLYHQVWMLLMQIEKENNSG